MRRTVITTVLIVLALFAIAGIIGYLIYNNYYYYSTDDAQVTGTIVNIVPTVPAGTLDTINVKVGDNVTAGQVIATISVPGNGGNTTSVNVTAPIAGTILQVTAVQGQTVAAGVPIAQETNLSNVNITAYVDEGQLNNISLNQTVDIHIDAYGDTSFTGHVSQIVNATASQFSLLPTQDNASGNFTKVGQRIPVIITLDGNAGKTLMPGMSAEVTIHLH